MPSWEMKLIKAEADRLIAEAADNLEVREELRELALAILSSIEVPSTPPAQPSGVNPDDDALKPDEPLHELTLGQARRISAVASPPDPGTITGADYLDDSLDAIEARCRVKAEAARRSADRLRHRVVTDESSESEHRADVAEWADRFTDCVYWLERVDDAAAPDLSLLDDLGGSFEALAAALNLVRSARREPSEKGLVLLAEAQSAVRSALRRVQAPDDPDQLAVYDWVRETAARQRVYLKRHMKADDLADPSLWSDLLGRIEAQSGDHSPARRHRPQIDAFHRLLDESREGREACDWEQILLALDALIVRGIPPSNAELRDLLLPIIEEIPVPDEMPEGVRLVFREIDRYLESRPNSPTSPDEHKHEPTAEVQAARRLLNGRTVVLIGGMCRPEAKDALRKTLGLGEVVWVETKEHQSVSSFEPSIARPEVALVLLAIRWSSHAFGEVGRICERLGKPLVRLPGGYSPNQIASQIIAQCSDRLE